MGLKNVADSKIGGLIDRGISGGERRRVTIAIQLLRNPSEYFLITSEKYKMFLIYLSFYLQFTNQYSACEKFILTVKHK